MNGLALQIAAKSAQIRNPGATQIRVLLVLAALFFVPRATAQSQTILTGTVQDPSGKIATSGYVQFRLASYGSVHYRVPGQATISPNSGKCGIDGTGHIKNLPLSGPCLIWGNDLILPANSCYEVAFAPNNLIEKIVPGIQISGATMDMANVSFCQNVRVTPEIAAVETSPSNANVIPGIDNFFVVGGVQNRYSNGYFTNLTVRGGQCIGCGIAGTVSAADYTSGSSTCGIQEAYNAIASSGGVVNVPRQTCDFATGTAVTVCANNITIEGQGSSATILRSKNADAIKLCNTLSGGMHEVRIRDLGIAPQSGSVSGDGIDLAETASAFENSHNSFERIVISNMPEQGFHDGNCSWCSFRDLVMQGNSGRGMEIGTSAGGKGGSSNDSTFTNVEVSTNAFGGMTVWGRNNTFVGGHWFANTSSNDLIVRGSNNTFVGGWFEDLVFFPSILIRRSDPTIYGNKFIGSHFTNVAGNASGPVVSIGQSGDAGGSVVGTVFQDGVFTCNDAPSPITCVANSFADISIDTSASSTVLLGNTYHATLSTALVDNGSNTASINDDIGSSNATKLFNLVASGNNLQANGITSRTASPAQSGFLQMAKTDAINIRNNGGSADLNLASLDGSNRLALGDAAGITTQAIPSAGPIGGTTPSTGAFTTLKVGASGSTLSDSRELVQSAHSCGSTTTCSNTSNGSNRMIFGRVSLSSGTPSTATVASINPAFTSTASYGCTLTNETTQANALKVSYVSGSSFTITGPNTVTDSVWYQCIGS